MISFKVQCISIVKRNANSTIDQRNCKGHEKRDQLLILKMEINYQVSQRNKSRDLFFFSSKMKIFEYFRLSCLPIFVGMSPPERLFLFSILKVLCNLVHFSLFQVSVVHFFFAIFITFF